MMRLNKTARQRESSPPPAREEPEAITDHLAPEPIVTRAEEPGRPYQDFVENHAREYWQAIGKEKNLSKPALEEIRTAATPILVKGLRRRTGSGKYTDPVLAILAVAVVVRQAREQGWIWPGSRSEKHPSPFFYKTLIQLVEDAHWMPFEIPLPLHPAPHHPPVYYYHETSKTGDYYPVARPDSLIRGDYVCTMDGRRITDDDYVHPWPYPRRHPAISRLIALELDACYVLKYRRPSVRVEIYWIETFRFGIQLVTANIEDLQFCSTGRDAAEPLETFSLALSEHPSTPDNLCNSLFRGCLSVLSRSTGIALRYFPALRRVVLDDSAVLHT